jgi:hypothetical protein
MELSNADGKSLSMDNFYPKMAKLIMSDWWF